ncbi:MAG: transcriptional regulator [Thaumarchaeota archaeon]|nr:transcriptional regulator [Nitrososphaerota archaeon]
MVNKKDKSVEKESTAAERKAIEKEIQEMRYQLEKMKSHSSKKPKEVPPKAKKLVERKKTVQEKNAVEEKIEDMSDEEIENLQIGNLDMDKLTAKVCDIIGKYDEGIFQSELWKNLKLSSKDGSRFALKLDKMGIVKREKILENGRWTYKLKLNQVPVSTQSLEDAPCLVCPVEQKCSLEGEISPRTCQWIEEWVITKFAKSKGIRKKK